MRPIALTGGIGAGKSTVAGLLRQRGAVVVDADQLARDVVEPGTPGFGLVVAAFGDSVVGSDGQLDRAELARRVFADAEARGVLERIVHPLVAEASREAFAAAPLDALLVYEIPLLEEVDRDQEWAAVVVVDASDEIRLARLVDRGLSAVDARQRMAAQASREERLALADHVVNNEGSEADLDDQVGELWPKLLTLK